MSRKKVETKNPINTSTEDTEENEKEFDGQSAEQIGINSKDELPTTQTIITINGVDYTEKMLLERLEKTGLLDDYLGEGRDISVQSHQWVESFSRDDLLQIFTIFPSVFELSNTQMNNTLGLAVKDILLFNDTFCNLFENILKKAKKIHLKYGWGFGEGTPEFHEFELAVSLFYTFVEEDCNSSSKKSKLSNALNRFADSDFVNLDNAGLPPIYTQLYKIIHEGRCSAGFSEQLSRVYTSIMLARTVLFYGNVLQKQWTEDSKEQRTGAGLWDYHQAASFFKMKKSLKKEMEAPLYHGRIDTERAEFLLTNSGDYLARYSSNRKQYYFTVLLGSFKSNKIVLNLEIPAEKLESWITKPMENREEIESYIKEKLLMQKENLKSYIDDFLSNEHYSPIFNQLCSEDMRQALPKTS